MPYYPRVIPNGETFDAIVDAHWAPAIWVSHDHDTASDAQDAAEVTARGLNLRDYEQLVAAGFTETDLPDAEADMAVLDPEMRHVDPLTKNEPHPVEPVEDLIDADVQNAREAANALIRDAEAAANDNPDNV